MSWTGFYIQYSIAFGLPSCIPLFLGDGMYGDEDTRPLYNLAANRRHHSCACATIVTEAGQGIQVFLSRLWFLFFKDFSTPWQFCKCQTVFTQPCCQSSDPLPKKTRNTAVLSFTFSLSHGSPQRPGWKNCGEAVFSGGVHPVQLPSLDSNQHWTSKVERNSVANHVRWWTLNESGASPT